MMRKEKEREERGEGKEGWEREKRKREKETEREVHTTTCEIMIVIICKTLLKAIIINDFICPLLSPSFLLCSPLVKENKQSTSM